MNNTETLMACINEREEGLGKEEVREEERCRYRKSKG